MYEFFDILFEIRVVKERLEYVGFLSFYDIFMGINFMVIKLLFNLQNKWCDCVVMYNCIYSVLFLFFIYFCDFVYDMSEVFNDLSFDFDMNINIQLWIVSEKYYSVKFLFCV